MAMHSGSPVIIEEARRLHRLHAKAKEILAAHGGLPLAGDHVEDIPVKKPKGPKPKKHGKQPPPSPTDEPDDTPRAPGAPRPGSRRVDGEPEEPVDDDDDSEDLGDDDDDKDDSTADIDRKPRRRGKQDKRKPAEPKKEDEIAAARRVLATARALLAAQALERRRAAARKRLRIEERDVAHADRVFRSARFDVPTMAAAHVKLLEDRTPARVDYAENLRAMTKAGLSRKQQAEALVAAHESGPVDTSIVATGVRWDSWGWEAK
jgi:hypothetical protein